jgi:hypothetical protein
MSIKTNNTPTFVNYFKHQLFDARKIIYRKRYIYTHLGNFITSHETEIYPIGAIFYIYNFKRI